MKCTGGMLGKCDKERVKGDGEEGEARQNEVRGVGVAAYYNPLELLEDKGTFLQPTQILWRNQ